MNFPCILQDDRKNISYILLPFIAKLHSKAPAAIPEEFVEEFWMSLYQTNIDVDIYLHYESTRPLSKLQWE